MAPPRVEFYYYRFTLCDLCGLFVESVRDVFLDFFIVHEKLTGCIVSSVALFFKNFSKDINISVKDSC